MSGGRFGRPEIFEISENSKVGPTSSNGFYKNSPLLLSACPGDMDFEYVEMDRFISILQQIRSPLSYHFQEQFSMEGMPFLRKLRSLDEQVRFYNNLNKEGFDFSKMPFKLQEWDQEVKEWRMLTIDYQILAACFLTYLCRNPGAVYTDTFHARERLGFHTRSVHEGRGLPGYVEVIPYLEIIRPGRIKEERHLLLTINGNKISFPELKIVMPAIITSPPGGFSCLICFDEPPDCNLVFKSMCGHCFHRHCIEQWFASSRNNQCPCCRGAVGSIVNAQYY
jgi:hypothetical protein